MIRTAILVAFFCLSSISAPEAQAVSKDSAQAPNGIYSVNEDHTQLQFSVLHLGLTDYFGRFDKISGTLNWDGAHPEHSTVSVSVDMTSLDTPSERLNNALKTMFRTQQFPTATFKSTSIRRTGPNSGEITGMLTIREVSKPVTLEATFNGAGRSLLGSGQALGFHAFGTIHRSDFGLTRVFWSAFVSDDVHLIIEAMFDQQKS